MDTRQNAAIDTRSTRLEVLQPVDGGQASGGVVDVKVVLGGTIVDEDLPAMEELGVAAVFQPGASLESIIHFMRENRPKREFL